MLDFSVMVNGSPKFKGILARRPFVPLAFYYSYYLSWITEALSNNGTMEGFMVSNREGGLVISHLQFADDTMFFWMPIRRM